MEEPATEHQAKQKNAILTIVQVHTFFIRDHIFIIYCINVSNNSFVVNCQWGDWNSGDCSKSCGLGQMTKTRVKALVEAHGGACSGDTTSTEACNTNPCAGMKYSR